MGIVWFILFIEIVYCFFDYGFCFFGWIRLGLGLRVRDRIGGGVIVGMVEFLVEWLVGRVDMVVGEEIG